MWLRMITRELRAKAGKDSRNFRDQQERKRKLERKLGIVKKNLEPDDTYCIDGISVAVHIHRARYRAEPEFSFEFRRKDGTRLFDDFGIKNLDALERAIQACKSYPKFVASQNVLRTGSKRRARSNA